MVVAEVAIVVAAEVAEVVAVAVVAYDEQVVFVMEFGLECYHFSIALEFEQPIAVWLVLVAVRNSCFGASCCSVNSCSAAVACPCPGPCFAPYFGSPSDYFLPYYSHLPGFLSLPEAASPSV